MRATGSETANVFVLGLDELNHRVLERLRGAEALRFHELLGRDELLDLENLDLTKALAQAERTLRDFDGRVDAVVGYWDFPVSTLVPVLTHRFDLPGPELDGVLRCEHKYWSRLGQAKVTQDLPAFGLVSFEDPVPPDGVSFPMWVKPVKSASSQLAFRVEDEAQLSDAVARIRDGGAHFGRHFELLLEHADLPPEIEAVGGRACLAEEAVTGRQFTVEGYCTADVPHVYGIVESVPYPDGPSFHRYQYPASLPREVEERLGDVTFRVMRQLGLGHGAFNIEFFWDPETDLIRLLEVNPRTSQSHAQLFEYVDGGSNLGTVVQLGLGQEPRMPHGRGEYAVAAKAFLRSFHDAIVTRSPSPDQVDRIEREIPSASISAVVAEGTRLSEIPHQEPYSYVLADIVVAGDDESELLGRYERCVEALGFALDEVAQQEG